MIMYFCSISLLLSLIVTIDARVGNVDRSNKNNDNVAIADSTTNGSSVVRKAVEDDNLSPDVICPKIEEWSESQQCTATCIHGGKNVEYSCEPLNHIKVNISIENLDMPTTADYKTCGIYGSFYDDELLDEGERLCIKVLGLVDLLTFSQNEEEVPNIDECEAIIDGSTNSIERWECMECGSSTGEINVEGAESGFTTDLQLTYHGNYGTVITVMTISQCLPFMANYQSFISKLARIVQGREDVEVGDDDE